MIDCTSKSSKIVWFSLELKFQFSGGLREGSVDFPLSYYPEMTALSFLMNKKLIEKLLNRPLCLKLKCPNDFFFEKVLGHLDF